jgi:hypothetical protein
MVNSPVTQDGFSFHFPDGGAPYRVFTLTVEPRFWAWSSNRYTLDFVITESYYTEFGVPPQYPVPFLLRYEQLEPNNLPCVSFYPFAAPFTDPHFFVLPSAPEDYWLPPFE